MASESCLNEELPQTLIHQHISDSMQNFYTRTVPSLDGTQWFSVLNTEFIVGEVTSLPHKCLSDAPE